MKMSSRKCSIQYMVRSGLLACLLGVLTLGTTALAQEALIPYALNTPVSSLLPAQPATLTGTVTAVDGNRFVLQDSSGSVFVETFPSWYRTFFVAEGVTLSVVGELNAEGSFDAFKILHESGETTLVRPFYAHAPWYASEPLRIMPTRVW